MKQGVWFLKKNKIDGLLTILTPKIRNINWCRHPKNNKEVLAAHKFDSIDEGSSIYQ